MASGSGHHLVLASGPSQLPAAILRGWCARAVGGAGCKPDLGVLPSGAREDLGVDATKNIASPHPVTASLGRRRAPLFPSREPPGLC